MPLVPQSAWRRWGRAADVRFPDLVETKGPHCGHRVRFEVDGATVHRPPLRAALLLLAALTSAGCGDFEGPFLGVQPYTVVGGAPTKLGPGWGVEAGRLYHFGDYADALSLRYAWSHHEGEPGWPDAEYFRLGGQVGRSFTKSFSSTSLMGFSASAGGGYYQILTDGPGDRGGPGVMVEPELWFIIRDSTRISLGCTAEGWVSMDGDLIGSLSPFLRFGIAF